MHMLARALNDNLASNWKTKLSRKVGHECAVFAKADLCKPGFITSDELAEAISPIDGSNFEVINIL